MAVPLRVCGMCVAVSNPECSKTGLKEQRREECQARLVRADKSTPTLTTEGGESEGSVIEYCTRKPTQR
jgi:hypothetical protein